MIRRFESGDVVQATLQGRRMTVVKYDHYGNVVCRWFDAAGLLQEATFSQHVLKLLESDAHGFGGGAASRRT